MNNFSLVGLFAVTAMALSDTLEKRTPCFLMGFSASYFLGSIYGVLQGAWPFGIVEVVWSGIAAGAGGPPKLR
jgi:hypothetical protein